MNETKLLNDTAVCNRCGREYIPECSFHKEPGICDSCNDDDIYLQDCAICHTQYNITDPGASIHYCSECQKVFDTERREWIKRFGNIQ